MYFRKGVKGGIFIVFLHLFLPFSLVSCGGGVAPDAPPGPDDIFQPLKSHFDYIVDSEKGVDSVSYDSKAGFRTITHAIRYIQSYFPHRWDEVTIYVEKGEYSEASGERFPIVIDDNIGVYGSLGAKIMNRGTFVVDSLYNIKIDRPLSVVLSGNSKLSNFYIDSLVSG